jgi:hypothetical protein
MKYVYSNQQSTGGRRKYFFVSSNEKYSSGLGQLSIKVQSWSLFVNDEIGIKWSVCFLDQGA